MITCIDAYWYLSCWVNLYIIRYWYELLYGRSMYWCKHVHIWIIVWKDTHRYLNCQVDWSIHIENCMQWWYTSILLLLHKWIFIFVLPNAKISIENISIKCLLFHTLTQSISFKKTLCWWRTMNWFNVHFFLIVKLSFRVGYYFLCCS